MGVLLVNGGMRYAVVGVFLVFGGLFVANAGAAPLYLEAGSAFPRRDSNRTAPQLSLDPLEFAAKPVPVQGGADQFSQVFKSFQYSSIQRFKDLSPFEVHPRFRGGGILGISVKEFSCPKGQWRPLVTLPGKYRTSSLRRKTNWSPRNKQKPIKPPSNGMVHACSLVTCPCRRVSHALVETKPHENAPPRRSCMPSKRE